MKTVPTDAQAPPVTKLAGLMNVLAIHPKAKREKCQQPYEARP
jgi:hypothetical protein